MSNLTPARRRRRFVAAATLIATVAVPATASAAHVTSPQPWKASNTYYARADLDGRAAPQLKPVARVNHVKAGQWVRITCQTKGQTAYGSNVWSKVDGLYVPDRYLKTYTDGLIQGVPSCGAHEPTPPPPAKPSPPTPTRAELSAAADSVVAEQVYGSNYRIAKEKYPNPDNKPIGIIWKNNGCSVPKKIIEAKFRNVPVGKAVGYYAKLFVKSCDRHDFGYRNYGSKTNGLKLDPTGARRAQIDNTLHSNMDYQCKKIFPGGGFEAIKRGTCYKASDLFYKAVSMFGGRNFA